MNSDQIKEKISTALMDEILQGAQVVFHYTTGSSNNIILVRRSRTQLKNKSPAFGLYQLPTAEGAKYTLVATIGEKMTDLQVIRLAKILAKQVTATNFQFNKHQTI